MSSGGGESREEPGDSQASESADAPPRSDPLGETIDSQAGQGSSRTGESSLDELLPASFGRHEVRHEIGRGGYGAVYLGYDTQLRRQVAIKVPRFADSANRQVQAFLREARQLAALNHSGIVTIYDVGIQDGRCYIVTDYLEGQSLFELIRENPPAWPESVRIVAAIADALAHAHAHRTVHRDVKPGNIILKNDNVPVLVDFGLAISDQEVSDSDLGKVSGTPHYMSPEQAAGQGHRIDGRTDIYALGVVLYQMVSGRLPFHAKTRRELLRRVCSDDPQPLRQLVPDVVAEVDEICQQAMARHISDRFATAGDMAAALRAVLESDTESDHASAARTTQLELSSQQVPPVVPRSRDAERRQVTVMYCESDLFDSAEFLENLDPEEQYELLANFQQLCERAVGRYGGTIVQSTGKGLLVCFGYPTAYEDAARRAILAGLEIQEGILGLNQGLTAANIRLSPWIGIHTSFVTVQQTRDSRSPEPMSLEPMSLVGEARSVATQLQVACDGGAVVITQAVHRLVEGYFVCESKGAHALKGAAQPLEVLKVTSESKAKTRIDVGEATGLTPLVGRGREVELLKDRWEKVEEGSAQIVLLSGEAGLGKSRLVHVLKQHVSKKQPSGSESIIEWRCSPYYQNSGLYPVVDYFRRAASMHRNDAPDKKLDKLVAFLGHYNIAGLDEVIPLLAALLSIPTEDRYPPLNLTPIRQKEKTFDALIDWLREHAAQQPVLFVLEDLHWVDPSTLDFLEMLVDQCAGDAVLLLFTFRPEFEIPWGSREHQTQIALNPLRKEQVVEMIQVKTGIKDVLPEFAEQIADRTGCVPLFVEEFARMLQDSGSIQEVDGVTVLASSFSLQAIPATLQDLLMARLDRMDADREVIQTAAAIGREFSHELIQAVSTLDESTLENELRKLAKAEVLFQRGRAPGATYQFKHALIQDAAYSSLLKKKRQQFHKKIAEIFENDFDQTAATQPELLAHHYTEAGQTEKAVQYWLKAGQYAQQRSANNEAISHLTRGLELFKSLEESSSRDQLEFGLQATLAPVLMAACGWSAPEVGTAIERAKQLVSKIGTVEDQFFVMWGLWGWRVIRADMDICQGIADDIMRLVEKSSEGNELLSEAYWCVGCTAYYKGDFTNGLKLLEKGLALVDGDKEPLYALRTGQCCSVMCRSHIALALWELGFPTQAMERADEMVRLAKELDHPFSYAMGMFFRRQIQEFSGLRDQALASIEQEYEICHENGFVFFEVHAIFGRGDSLVRQGRIDEARELFDRGLTMLSATGGNLSMDFPYRNIAEVFLLAGLPDDANEWLNRAIDLVNHRNERHMECEVLRLQGELALAADDQTRAEECYQRAVEVAQQQRAKSWELRAMISFSELKIRQGKQSEARQMLESTYSFFTEGFDTSDLVRAKALLSE